MNNDIIQKITKEEVKMKPKAYFVFKAVLVGLVFFFCFLLALFLISLVLFSCCSGGLRHFFGFGFSGFGFLFFNLPWLLIALSLILIFVLEVLLKKFSFAWRKPALYSLLAVAIFVFLVSGVIARAGLHQGLANRANRGGLPVFGPVYRRLPQPIVPQRGVIKDKDNGYFWLENEEGQELPFTFVLTKRTQPRLEQMVFAIGDGVIVLTRPIRNTTSSLEVLRLQQWR